MRKRSVGEVYREHKRNEKFKQDFGMTKKELINKLLIFFIARPLFFLLIFVFVAIIIIGFMKFLEWGMNRLNSNHSTGRIYSSQFSGEDKYDSFYKNKENLQKYLKLISDDFFSYTSKADILIQIAYTSSRNNVDPVLLFLTREALIRKAKRIKQINALQYFGKHRDELKYYDKICSKFECAYEKARCFEGGTFGYLRLTSVNWLTECFRKYSFNPWKEEGNLECMADIINRSMTLSGALQKIGLSEKEINWVKKNSGKT